MARLFVIEALVLARRADAAIADAGRVLAQRPRDREALALRAAALTVESRAGAAEARALRDAVRRVAAAEIVPRFRALAEGEVDVKSS